jgi:hypothetical protein
MLAGAVVGGVVESDTKTKKKRKLKKPKEVVEAAEEEDIHVVNMNDAVGEEEDLEAEKREQEAEWALEEEDADDELIEFLDPSPPVGLDADPANPRLRHSSTLNLRRKSEYLCRVAANRAVSERKNKNSSSLSGMISGMFLFGRRNSTSAGGLGPASAVLDAEKVRLARDAQLARVKLCVDEMRRLQQRRREAKAGGREDQSMGGDVGTRSTSQPPGPLKATSLSGGKGRGRRSRPAGSTPGSAGSAAVLSGSTSASALSGPGSTSSGRSRSAGPGGGAVDGAEEGGSSALIPKVRSSFISNLRQMVAAAEVPR